MSGTYFGVLSREALFSVLPFADNVAPSDVLPEMPGIFHAEP
jgi:hypothetical protein